MKAPGVVLLSLLMLGCATPTPSPNTEGPIRVANWELTLLSKSPYCEVTASSITEREKRVNLRIPPPCGFVRSPRGEALVHGYIDVSADVVIVVGELERGCGRPSRGVLVRSTSVTLSPRLAHGPLKCVAKGMNEKEYWLFAHPGQQRRSESAR